MPFNIFSVVLHHFRSFYNKSYCPIMFLLLFAWIKKVLVLYSYRLNINLYPKPNKFVAKTVWCLKLKQIEESNQICSKLTVEMACWKCVIFFHLKQVLVSTSSLSLRHISFRFIFQIHFLCCSFFVVIIIWKIHFHRMFIGVTYIFLQFIKLVSWIFLVFELNGIYDLLHSLKLF